MIFLLGFATRFCDYEGVWDEDEDVSNCQRYEFMSVFTSVSCWGVCLLKDQSLNYLTSFLCSLFFFFVGFVCFVSLFSATYLFVLLLLPSQP